MLNLGPEDVLVLAVAVAVVAAAISVLRAFRSGR
jgi:hypothetical protein